MTDTDNKTLIAIALGWVAVLCAVTFFRPLMPVDETRYMTVAWEMLVRDSWVLPTLNYEPYSHKPPLLFWLIRLGWALSDVGITPARVMLGLFVMGLFWLTGRLAKTLFPEQAGLPATSMLLLAGLPAFLIYASMIMFDTLLAFFVVAGLIAIRKSAQSGLARYWALLALAIGLGILAKGPVALVYILPTALLAPLWMDPLANKRQWYGRLGLAVLGGAVIALSWAIPAALEGGDAYAHKIFLKQSAGRMVNAFDHQQPFWFYLPVIAGFLAPLLVWPAFWRGMKHLKNEIRNGQREADVFLLCQIVPVFVFFSTISSKQFHYMIPLLPAIAILVARSVLKSAVSLRAMTPVMMTALPSVAMLAVYGYILVTGHEPKHLGLMLGGFMPLLAVAHIVACSGLARYNAANPLRGPAVMAFSAFLLFGILHMQLGQDFLKRYDFSPLRPVIEKFEGYPLLVGPKYDGEYGFELRLKKPVLVFENHLIADWLREHRDTVVIMRVNKDTVHQPFYYYVIASIPFRDSKRIDVLAYKLRPYEKLYWRNTPLFENENFMRDKK